MKQHLLGFVTRPGTAPRARPRRHRRGMRLFWREGRLVPQVIEQKIVNAILRYMAYAGIPGVHHRNTGRICHRPDGSLYFGRDSFNQAGAADIICAWKGWAVAVEVKSAKGFVRPEQKNWLSRWREKGGGISIIVRSLDEFISFVEKLPNHPVKICDGIPLQSNRQSSHLLQQPE